jgi:guanylate kinase
VSARTGLLIVISGPSGVGKDAVVTDLLKRDSRLRYSVSYTTRPRRDYEVNGRHYYFVNEPQFIRLVERGELLEHARYNGYLYGTSRARVEEAQREGIDIILKIDVQGAEQVRRRRPDGIFIFIAPPSLEELERRRTSRHSEPEDVMRERQQTALKEMALAERYDYVVVNDDLERAVKEIQSIIRKERARRIKKNGSEPD